MATERQKKAIAKVAENGGNVSKAMRESGYSRITSATPKKLTGSKAWEELMEKHLPDQELAKVHRAMLNAHSIEHIVFPLNISDEEIKELLKTVNCVVKKFMHSETQTHCWFWSPDNKAKKDALDMAYKLKGKYKADKVELGGEIKQILPDEQFRNIISQTKKRLSNNGS